MSTKFKLEVVTPDRNFFDDDVEMIVVRTTEGDIGVLNNHEPSVAPLAIGKIRVKQDNGGFKTAACSGGFISIEEEKTVIITDSAEWSHEIDLKRANEARDRADERISSKSDKVDRMRAKLALYRAINRIKAVESK